MLAEISEKDFRNSLTVSSYSSLTSLDTSTHEANSVYDDLTTIKTIYDGKVVIYLVYAPNVKQYYALKAFNWENGQISSYFLREARFHKFHHHNIISIPHYVCEFEIDYNDGPTTVSYLLMEYAKYGDMFNMIVRYKTPFNEKLTRTYFHQLISGLEYLHSHGAAHLDVKLENLLLGEDFILKLADFDLSYLHEDGEVKTKGTKNFRAPELLNRECKDPYAADIYSTGIMLFLFLTEGNLPYLEDNFGKKEGLPQLKEAGSCLFWEKHLSFLKKNSTFFSEDFKALFLAMTKFNPEERATIPEIKASAWYKGPTYTGEELVEYMQGHFGF